MYQTKGRRRTALCGAYERCQADPDDDTSTDSVVFVGCIRIYDNDDTPVPDRGDLDGDITVNVCHATADDLNITVEGAWNGAIDINQTTCQNQVTWSSGSCP